MRYELDDEGYILHVFFGCFSGLCTEYTGEVPEGYETLSLWAENANIRAYRIVEGNLVLDVAKKAELERLYEKEAEENSCASKKYVNDKLNNVNTIYDEELSSTIEGSSLFSIKNTRDAEIAEIKVTALEPLTKNFNIKITNANMLMNKGLNQEINGLTFEVNNDKSITINGTATADTEFIINGSLTNTDALFFIKDNEYYVQHGFVDGVKLNLYSYDGENRTLVSSIVNGAIYLSSTAYITYVTLKIAKGTKFKDVTVYPMIERGGYFEHVKYKYVECKENEMLNIDLGEYTIGKGKDVLIYRTGYMFTNNVYLYPSDNLYPSDDLFPIDYEETIWGIAATQKTFEEKTLIQCDKNVTLNIKYFSKDYINERFSQIQVEQDEIKLQVGEKVGNDEIISKINLTKEAITIDANRININGTVSANGNFKVDKYGNMECNNGKFNGSINLTDVSSSDTSRFSVKGNGLEYYLNPGMFAFYNGNKYIITEMTETEMPTIMLGYDITHNWPYETTWVSADGIDTPSLTQTSLAESKKNFEKLEDNAIELIKNIDIYKYNLKNENDTDKKHIGFVIGEDYNYSEEVTSSNNTGVDNYSFTSLCCKAIQEQQKIIEDLQRQINELKEVKQ